MIGQYNTKTTKDDIHVAFEHVSIAGGLTKGRDKLVHNLFNKIKDKIDEYKDCEDQEYEDEM